MGGSLRVHHFGGSAVTVVGGVVGPSYGLFRLRIMRLAIRPTSKGDLVHLACVYEPIEGTVTLSFAAISATFLPFSAVACAIQSSPPIPASCFMLSELDSDTCILLHAA